MTHPFTSVPTTLVNTVGVAVTTVGAGFTPARSGARGSTQPAYLSKGDTRDATMRNVAPMHTNISDPKLNLPYSVLPQATMRYVARRSCFEAFRTVINFEAT